MRKLKSFVWIAAVFLLAGASLADTDSSKLRHFLDHSVDWYQRISAIDPAPISSQEYLFRQTVREEARQAIEKGFEFGRADAEILAATEKSSTSQKASASAQRLPGMMAAADARIKQLEQQVSDAATAAQDAKPEDHAAARARQSKAQAQLNLANATSAAMHNYAEYLASSNGKGASLIDQIDELQRSVPEAAPSATTKAASSAAPPAVREADGLFSLISEIFAITRRMATLSSIADETQSLESQNDDLHAPVRAQLLDVLQHGQQIGAATVPSATVDQLNAQTDQIDSMANGLTRMSAIAIAMSAQHADLETTRHSLLSWRSAIATQYATDLRALIVRVGGVALLILFIVVVSELWRRATFRYVHDTRRRRQLMLIRRIVIGFCVALVIIGSVITEIGSLATFAGLITAGIAVSLQTVILSGVAYFFFIGRFGVRVGDRVTIAGITGDVVEVGLFRLYLMELGGQNGDLHSTGRMIVFSNAVLFQPSAFYKQLPGAQYVWHEVAMTLSAEGDHLLAEQRLMNAVNAVFETYRQRIDDQYESAMQTLHVTLDRPRPEGRLRFVDAGVEYVIRYPVELDQASKTDDQITRKLLDTVNEEPKLKFAASATPRIQQVK